MPYDTTQGGQQDVHDQMADIRPVVSEEKRAAAPFSRRRNQKHGHHGSEESEQQSRCKKTCMPRAGDQERTRYEHLSRNDRATGGRRQVLRKKRVVLQCEHERRPVKEFVHCTDSKQAADCERREECDALHSSPGNRLTGAALFAIGDPPVVIRHSGQWRTVRLTVRPRPSAFPPMLHGICLADNRSSHGNHMLPSRTNPIWRTAIGRSHGPGPETAPVSIQLKESVS